MAVYPRLTVLPIGQGSCNLVEVYDRPFSGNIPQGNLIYLAMVDCGTSHGMTDPWSNPKYSHIAASLDYVEHKMRERAACLGVPDYYLDSFDLTHQDADHWNLFRPLILHMFRLSTDSILKIVNGAIQTKIKIQNRTPEILTINNYTNTATYSKSGVIKAIGGVIDAYNYFFQVSSQSNLDVSKNNIEYNIEYSHLIDATRDIYIQMLVKNEVEGKTKFVIKITMDNIKHVCVVIRNNSDNTYNYITLHVKDFNKDEEDDLNLCFLPINKFEVTSNLENIYILLIICDGMFKITNCGFLNNKNINIAFKSSWETLYHLLDFEISINHLEDNIYLINKYEDIKERLKGVTVSKNPFIHSSSCGGLEYSKSALDFLDLLQSCSYTSLEHYSNSGATSYKMAARIGQPGDMKRYMLANLTETNIRETNTNISNVRAVDLGTTRNASGSMFLWTFNEDVADKTVPKYSYLFTGDATVHSMFQVTSKLPNQVSPIPPIPPTPLTPPTLQTLVNGCIMTAPHHGSDHSSSVTTLINGISNTSWRYLENFLTKIKPSAIAVSAGQLSEHGHPGIQFMNTALKFLSQQATEQQHSFCWYTGIKVLNKRIFGLNITKNKFYTTVQAKDITQLINNGIQATELNSCYAIHFFYEDRHDFFPL